MPANCRNGSCDQLSGREGPPETRPANQFKLNKPVVATCELGPLGPEAPEPPAPPDPPPPEILGGAPLCEPPSEERSTSFEVVARGSGDSGAWLAGSHPRTNSVLALACWEQPANARTPQAKSGVNRANIGMSPAWEAHPSVDLPCVMYPVASNPYGARGATHFHRPADGALEVLELVLKTNSTFVAVSLE